MGKHTTGPWEIQDPMGEDLWIVQAGLEAYEWTRIASVSADDSTDAMDRGASRPITKQERAANARLIAAAPDLLEALLLFVDGFDPDREYTDPAGTAFEDKARHALAAIRKATA